MQRSLVRGTLSLSSLCKSAGSVPRLSLSSSSAVKEIVRTDKAPPAAGPYSQAVKANGMLFVSGVLGLNPNTAKFECGGNLEKQTQQLMENLKAVLEAGGSCPEKVVKCTVLLKNIEDWPAVNQIYAKTFHTDPPARAAYAVKDLPLNALVEIEAIALA